MQTSATIAALYQTPLAELSAAFMAWDAFHAANPVGSATPQLYARARRAAFTTLRQAAHRFTPAQLSKAVFDDANSLRYLLAAA